MMREDIKTKEDAVKFLKENFSSMQESHNERARLIRLAEKGLEFMPLEKDFLDMQKYKLKDQKEKIEVAKKMLEIVNKMEEGKNEF